MKRAKLTLDRNFTVGPVSPYLYGTFVENVSKVVYGGFYDPDHPTADSLGFRGDVAALMRELGTTVVRFPGGNGVSAYHWKDGVGPKDRRPARYDLAWGDPDAPADTNQVGIDEFADYLKALGPDYMLAANLGTGTPEEAAQEVEYCNLKGGTYWSDLRRKNGREEPHEIKLWCLGNEMDGVWQVGHMLPEEYARKAEETAKMMKQVDKTIKLVVCGSCDDAQELRTYPDWDRIVLDRTYPYVDYVAIHKYLSYHPDVHMAHHHPYTIDDIAHFPLANDRYLKTVLAAADLARGKHRGDHDIMVSVDEWGVSTCGQVCPQGLDWPPMPRVDFAGDLSMVLPTNMIDALLFGSFLMTFLDHADRVGAACQTLVLGSMIAIRPDTCWRQTTFYPFAQAAKYGRGTALRQNLSAPPVETPHFGLVPSVQTAAVWNGEKSEVVVFAVNFSFTDAVSLEVGLQDFGPAALVEHLELQEDMPLVCNSQENPDRVTPRQVPVETDAPVLKKMSWNVLRYRVERE